MILYIDIYKILEIGHQQTGDVATQLIRLRCPTITFVAVHVKSGCRVLPSFPVCERYGDHVLLPDARPPVPLPPGATGHRTV